MNEKDDEDKQTLIRSESLKGEDWKALLGWYDNEDIRDCEVRILSNFSILFWPLSGLEAPPLMWNDWNSFCLTDNQASPYGSWLYIFDKSLKHFLQTGLNVTAWVQISIHLIWVH